MKDYQTETELRLAVQAGALRYGVERALDLLEDPDASEHDANHVIRMLYAILQGSPMARSGNFVTGISTRDMGGNCPLDLVHLADGQVIGIDSETAVLYSSAHDVDNHESVERPCIQHYRG